jgi:hypothetical protein
MSALSFVRLAVSSDFKSFDHKHIWRRLRSHKGNVYLVTDRAKLVKLEHIHKANYVWRKPLLGHGYNSLGPHITHSWLCV